MSILTIDMYILPIIYICIYDQRLFHKGAMRIPQITLSVRSFVSVYPMRHLFAPRSTFIYIINFHPRHSSISLNIITCPRQRCWPPSAVELYPHPEEVGRRGRGTIRHGRMVVFFFGGGGGAYYTWVRPYLSFFLTRYFGALICLIWVTLSKQNVCTYL